MYPGQPRGQVAPRAAGKPGDHQPRTRRNARAAGGDDRRVHARSVDRISSTASSGTRARRRPSGRRPRWPAGGLCRAAPPGVFDRSRSTATPRARPTSSGCPSAIRGPRTTGASATVVYGHTPVPDAVWINNTICIDTGCVFGGKLTALRYPERELVSVPAAATYYEPVSPLAPTSATRPPGRWRRSTSTTCSASGSSTTRLHSRRRSARRTPIAPWR